MSLVIAAALPNFAIVLSDTRGCLSGVPVTDELRKVFALPNGRAFLQSGPSVGYGAELHQRLLATDGSLAEMIAAAQEWAPDEMRALEESDPDMAHLVRTTQSSIIVGASDTTPYVLEMDWAGRVLNFGPNQTVVGGPDSLADVLPAKQDALNDFIEANDVDSLTFGALIDYCASELFRDIHQRCELVGPNLEAGIVVQTRPGVYESFLVAYKQPGVPVQMTAYRAYVRAKSLRLGRSQGLTGDALELRVADDLRASIDDKTGIATIPEALRYSDGITMTTPLGRDTMGGGLQTWLNDNLEAKFIVPFVKVSTNIFRYVHKSILGLNMLNADTRAALARGGEEAAIINTRAGIATTFYGYAAYQTMAGNLTGRGPTDPALRKLWLKDHQPYSIKIDGKWISYRSLEPLAAPLGLIADIHTVWNELDAKATEATELAYGTVAAIFYNIASKSYMSGLTEFSNAWANNDPRALQRWSRAFAGTFVVPNLVSSMNPDPVMHDVQSVADAMISRIPGYSKTLDPKFDLFGEPILKTPGLLNRTQIFTGKDATHSVESDLVALGKGLAPLSPTMPETKINLQDRTAFDNGTHKSPYIRMMELLRNPSNGQPSMRDAMTQLVRSAKWQESSDGTSLMPGGKRWLLAAAIKQKYEGHALKEVLQEYPLLRRQITAVQRMKGAAVQSGEQGVAYVESLFGVKAK